MSPRNNDISEEQWTFWWSWSFLLEGVLIFLGNAVTILVFWRKRVALKRTSFLLINLSFADLFVGVGVMALGVYAPQHEEIIYFQFALGSWICFSTTASICSLAVVAVERAFAIIRPLKHRAAPTAYYYRAIYLVWVVATLVAILFGLFITKVHPDTRFPIVVVFTTCLLTISLSYFTIWRSVTMKIPHIDVHGQERNRKLAKTLSIVTFFSLCTCLPMQVLTLFPSKSVEIDHWLMFLEFLNSVLNPFVYVLRMSEFRQELKRIFFGRCCRDRQEVIPMRNVCGRAAVTRPSSLSFGEEGSYKLRNVHEQIASANDVLK